MEFTSEEENDVLRSQELEFVRAEMESSARLANRDAADITLVAISKTRCADEIRPLIAAGQRVFGENRVQEAQDKWPILKQENGDIELHLVGQLQSNKALEAVELFDVIHSVDRPSLVTALVKAIAKSGRQPMCYIQVNIGDEDQKGGVAIDDIAALLKTCDEQNLEISGLMCVPPANVEAAPYFALAAKIARDHGLMAPNMALSMGMSGDYKTAIMMGATHIRVGTALFGART